MSRSVSPGRVPRFAITQRPSFVCTMDGCGVMPSRAWRQVWRSTGARRITHDMRSTSVDFATASWTAHDSCCPFPVRQRNSSAATMATASCSPAMWKACHICGAIGGFSDTLIVGAILGQMKLTKPQAAKAAELFGLSKTEEALINEVPMRGTGTPMPPTDPLIYRFYEMVMVNGPAWKALIEEQFGDGIISAIDFDMVMERLPNPKGDRVKITMSGKFLPYKYYGASGNIPEYGFKEG